MSSLQFFVEPAITNDIFISRLKEIGKGISQSGFNVSDPFPLLSGAKILEVAFAPRYIALLLEGGRVCRVGFSVSQEFAESVLQTQEKHAVLPAESQKQTDAASDGQPPSKRMASGSGGSHDSGLSLTRQRLGHHSSAVAAASVSRLASAISGSGSSSGRSRAMAASLVALGSRGLPPLPASMVPEALVQQVQTVLSGSKSRHLIIRELQRTHLDVNLAVNNLLSRDSDGEGDDDDDDIADGSSADPSEVVRLLDAAAASASGLVEHLLMDDDEDVQFVSRAAAQEHVRRAAAAFFDSSSTQEENYSSSSYQHSSSKITSFSTADAISFDKEIIFWLQEDGSPVLFSVIGAMHTELVGVDIYGHLQAWPWRDAKPPPFSSDNHGHLRARSLGLSPSDRISLLACASSRASIMTENMRIASWIDLSIRHQQTAVLEHPATAFPQVASMHIQKLSVSDIHTAVLTSAGSVYWWGALPYRMRCDRSQQSSTTSGSETRSGGGNVRSAWESENQPSAGFSLEAAKATIIPGAMVRLRTSPLVSCGALALGVPSSALPGVEICPRLAELMEDAWNPSSSYRFKLLPSSTATQTSSSSIFTKRKRASVVSQTTFENSPSSTSSHSGEEVCWPLADVILLNDGPSPPLGRVVKVDGEYAAVRFNNGNNSTGTTGNNSPMTQSDIETLLADCRLLRLSELEVVCGATLSTSISSKQRSRSAAAASSIQMWPRRLDSLAEPGFILGWLITADSPSPAVHILTRRSDGLYYRTVPLSVDRSSSKHGGKKQKNRHQKMQESSPGQLVHVPISMCLLSDQSTSFRLMAPSPANSTILFAIDQNGCVFPLSRPAVPSITSPSFCEPPFLRMGPVTAFAGGLAPNPRCSPTGSHQMPFFVAVTAFQLPLLTTCIQRRDLAGVKRVLRYFEKPDSAQEFATMLESERSDGERNVFHVAVEACAPLVGSSSSSSFSVSGGQRRSSFEEPADFDMPSFVDSGSSSRHRVTARRLTLRQMIREASSAAAVANSAGNVSGGNGNNSSRTGGNNNNSLSSNSQPWQIILDSKANSSAPSSATVTVNTVIEDSSSNNGIETLSDLVQSLANPYSYVVSSSSSSNTSSGEDLRRISSQSASESILAEMLKSKALQPHLSKLLSAVDCNSRTPFMAAVFNRAYSAAIQLLHSILAIVAEKEPVKQEEGSSPTSMKNLEPFIFPARHANADDNPFHMLCFNDTCSFTWTGAEHINQDIYECRSCGLVGSLCCCSECARVCHRGPGHDCRLKRTSPTAYCDCWEKCGCRGLLAGNQSDRFALAKELSKVIPQLVMLPTAAALGRPPESILSFLLRTLQRQQLEQRQYRGPPSRSSGIRSRSSAHSHGYRSHQPEAVDPPRFVRQALNFILDDPVLLGNIFTCLGDTASSTFSARPNNASYVCELDRVAFLVLRCSSDVHDRFARAIIELDQRGANEAVTTFIRSTVRAYSAIAASLPPNLALPSRGNSGNVGCIAALPLRGCRQLFASVPLVAVRELAGAASAIIRPVTLGMCRGPSSAHNLISPMMVTTSVPEAVDAAETMLIGHPSANEGNNQGGSGGRHENQGASSEGHHGSRSRHHGFSAGLFLGSRRGLEHSDEVDDMLDDDFDEDDDENDEGGSSSDGNDGNDGDEHMHFYDLSFPEHSMEEGAGGQLNSEQASAARSPSPLGVENYVDAEEYSGVVEATSGTSAQGTASVIVAQPDLPPPLLPPPSVGPSSSASSISGAASLSVAPSVAFTFAEPAVQQDVTDAEQEQQDETISLIRSAAATAGSEAGGASLISFTSENEDDVDTVSAVSSIAHQARNQATNQSSSGTSANPQPSGGSSRFRRRLQSSSSSSTSSSSNSSENSEEADVIRVMVASDMDDALMERDVLGGHHHHHHANVDDVSTDSSSINSAPRPISSIVNRSSAGGPPPPLGPPPVPPPPPPVQPSEPFRFHPGDIVLFGADMSPQQQVIAPSSVSSRGGRFVTASGGPVIDMSEMPLRTQSPTIFHAASSLAAAANAVSSNISSSNNANNSNTNNNAGGGGGSGGGGGHTSSSSILSPHMNELFQAANQQHLTRLFSILVRFAADLLSSLVASQGSNQSNASTNPILGGSSFLSIRSTTQQPTSIPPTALRILQDDVDTILEPALRWIVAAVDSIEAQLRCRHGYPDPAGHRPNEGASFSRDPISSARLSFGHHALNLIRDPHGLLPNPDFLPALRHAIDSLLSLIRSCSPLMAGIANTSDMSASGSRGLIRSSNRILGCVEVSDDSDDSLPSSAASHLSSPTILGRSNSDQFGKRGNNLFGGVTYSAPPPLTSWPSFRMEVAQATVAAAMTPVDASHPFFQRSISLTAVGWEAPPTFSTSAEEALPLALRPDILNPQSRKHELFGLRRQSGLAPNGLLAEFPADPFASVASSPMASVDATPDNTMDGSNTGFRGLRRPRVAGSELTEPLLAARWALVLNWVAALRPDGQGMDNQYGVGDFANMTGSDALLNFGRFLSSPPFGGDAIVAGFSGMPSWASNNNAVSMISPVNELVGGYSLVERRFRADMERLRNSQQREIVLADLERSPSSALLACVTRQLQFAFSRRTGTTASSTTRPYLAHSSSTGCPPLLCHKLKVSFQHEPGEGAGVARSLFTTFAEAVTAEDCRLPISQLRALMGDGHQQRSSILSGAMQPSTSGMSSSAGSALSGLMPPHAHGHSPSSSMRSSRGANIFSQLIPAFFSVPISRGGGSNSSSTRDWDRILRDAVTVAMLGARTGAFPQPPQPASSQPGSEGGGEQQLIIQIPEFTPNHPDMQARFPSHKLRFGVRLLSRVSAIEPRLASRIVYVLLHLTPNQLLQLLTSDSKLREVVAETALLINETAMVAPLAVPEDSSSNNNNAPRTRSDSNPNPPPAASNAEQDTSPLFYRLANGHLVPRVGRGSVERLVALRCIGRVIGLALLHAELCPFLLARHVVKYIIGKTPFCFHDLAFLDPVAFDSLRRIALDVTTLPPQEAQKLFEAIDLTAVVDLLPEEGGGRVELVLPNIGGSSPVEASASQAAENQTGGNPVTPSNALAFVLAYAELRLVHAARPALDAMRAGILDVVPSHVLESLTPEDVSLILCGTGTRISTEPVSQQRVVDRLRALTTIHNESGRDADMVRRFKGWFWAEISRLAKQSCNQPVQPQTTGASSSSGIPTAGNGSATSSTQNNNALADLLSFWTGSSALPATDAALIYTPPSLVVRPPDDMHLPTANTCISRLYVPLYSSRLILRRKLAIAIRTKMFGFV